MSKLRTKILNRTKSVEMFNQTYRSAVEPDDDLDNIKTMRVADIYKNIYTKDAGKSIVSLKFRNSEILKQTNPMRKTSNISMKSSLNR